MLDRKRSTFTDFRTYTHIYTYIYRFYVIRWPTSANFTRDPELNNPKPFNTIQEAQAAGAVTINPGRFLQFIINFLVICLALFFILKVGQFLFVCLFVLFCFVLFCFAICIVIINLAIDYSGCARARRENCCSGGGESAREEGRGERSRRFERRRGRRARCCQIDRCTLCRCSLAAKPKRQCPFCFGEIHDLATKCMVRRRAVVLSSVFFCSPTMFERTHAIALTALRLRVAESCRREESNR